MKKVWKTVLVLALAVLCLTAVAAAAEAPSGICNVTAGTGVVLTPKDAQGNTVPANDPTTNPAGKTNFYPGAVKVGMTYSTNVDPTAQYLVLVLTGDSDTPTETNVAYVDQAAGTVSFDIYPGSLKSGETYHIKLSSNASSGVTTLTDMGTFSYYAAYKLGDVDEDGNPDGRPTGNDVLYTLEASVGLRNLTANQALASDADGDGNSDGRPTGNDVLYILEASVGLRTL